MATQTIAGYKAKLLTKTSGSTTSPTSIGELTDVTLNISMSPIDATSHDSSGWEENIAGNKSWGGSASHFFVDANASQESVRDALLNDTKLAFEFQPIGSSTGQTYNGDGRITDWSQAAPTDDANAVDIEFVGTAAISTGTAA